MFLSRTAVGSQLNLGAAGVIADILGEQVLKPMKFFVPKIINDLVCTTSMETYYCPFEESSLNRTFVVRSSNVTFGNAFARSGPIQQALLTNKAIMGLNVGAVSLVLHKDARCVAASNQYPCDESDLKLTLDAVFATLDLLESYV